MEHIRLDLICVVTNHIQSKLQVDPAAWWSWDSCAGEAGVLLSRGAQKPNCAGAAEHVALALLAACCAAVGRPHWLCGVLKGFCLWLQHQYFEDPLCVGFAVLEYW